MGDDCLETVVGGIARAHTILNFHDVNPREERLKLSLRESERARVKWREGWRGMAVCSVLVPKMGGGGCGKFRRICLYSVVVVESVGDVVERGLTLRRAVASDLRRSWGGLYTRSNTVISRR